MILEINGRLEIGRKCFSSLGSRLGFLRRGKMTALLKTCLYTVLLSKGLLCFSKIIERIMYNRLYSFLTKHNIITEKQYVFRKKYATYMALIDLIDKISCNFDEKIYTMGVFLDLSKAFDTIDHTILLNKLQCYGVRGSACSWFASYLKNMKQYVVFNKTESECKEISCGVPQGSILGPLHFILYINDIEHVSEIIKPIYSLLMTRAYFIHIHALTLLFKK